MDALSIALSGLTAQTKKLDTIASNIANVSTSGRVPDAANPASTVYKPLDVSFTALTVGQGEPAGVRATVTEDTDGYSLSFDPGNPDANAEGLIAVPNVDLTEQVVDLINIKTVFRADLSIVKTKDEMDKDLLDILS
jgi:flagellar basal-body rod protein FlgC